MIEEMTLTLNSPITDEQWDAIADVDFEHTDRIWFKTKHGKDVEFVKQKRGQWLRVNEEEERAKHDGKLLGWMPWYCSECGAGVGKHQTPFCPNCGADMRGKQNGH